jgi:hypothetical protein
LTVELGPYLPPTLKRHAVALRMRARILYPLSKRRPYALDASRLRRAAGSQAERHPYSRKHQMSQALDLVRTDHGDVIELLDRSEAVHLPVFDDRLGDLWADAG